MQPVLLIGIFGMGWPELMIIAFVIMLLAGPKRISKFARGLKDSLKEVKTSVTPEDDEKDSEKKDSEKTA